MKRHYCKCCRYYVSETEMKVTCKRPHFDERGFYSLISTEMFKPLNCERYQPDFVIPGCSEKEVKDEISSYLSHREI